MYKITNGILFHDQLPLFALGQSYYSSFNRKKVPIAPGENRREQMELDLREMVDCGFNLLRTAAAEPVALREDGTVSCYYPWTDDSEIDYDMVIFYIKK